MYVCVYTHKCMCMQGDTEDSDLMLTLIGCLGLWVFFKSSYHSPDFRTWGRGDSWRTAESRKKIDIEMGLENQILLIAPEVSFMLHLLGCILVTGKMGLEKRLFLSISWMIEGSIACWSLICLDLEIFVQICKGTTGKRMCLELLKATSLQRSPSKSYVHMWVSEWVSVIFIWKCWEIEL